MLNPFKIRSWFKSVTGVEIHALPDGTYKLRSCEITLEKQELTIGKRNEDSELKSFLAKLPKDNPVALTLTGKHVLNKKIAGTDDWQPGMLSAVFPDLKVEQFYIQYFKGLKDSWVAIVRKDIADELIRGIKAAGLKALALNLGPFPVAPVLRQLNNYNNQIVFDGHRIAYNQEQQWAGYSYIPGDQAEFPLKIGIESIQQQHLLAYSTAFNLALHEVLPEHGVLAHAIQEELAEFKEEKKFKHRGLVFLISLFMLLLINFLLFQYYQGQNETLLSRVNRSAASTEQLEDKESAIRKNEVLLGDLHWNKGFSMAWLADQIGQTVPSSVLLHELSINPQKVKKSSTENVQYEVGNIVVRGQTSDLKQVNNWIYELQDKDWVKQVELKNFSVADEEGRQQFTLNIRYL